MSQTVSPEFDAAVAGSVNDPTFGVMVGWDKEYNDLATFFTIGTSEIGGPDFIKGSGEDVTFFDKFNMIPENDHIDSFSISRMSSLTPYGVFTSQAELVFDNISKRYMPGFDPDIGALVNKNRRPLKISAGFSGENIPQFVGFSDRPRAALMSEKMQMHAYDVMDYFSNKETSLTYFEDILASEVIEAILIDLGFTADQFSIEVSLQRRIGFLTTSGLKVATIFQRLCEAEQAVMFADETGIIKFWNRLHIPLTETGDVVKSFNYDNLQDIEWRDTPIINHMIIKAMPRAVAAVQPVWSSTGAIEVLAGEVIRIPVAFKDDDGTLPVTSIMDPVFIDLRDDANRSWYTVSLDENGEHLEGEGDITMTDVDLLGDIAFIEFTNSGPSIRYIAEMEIHGTPAKVFDRIEVEVKDQDSIDAYGINPESNSGEPIIIENNWIQDSSTARSLAQSQVDLYGDPDQQLVGKPFADPSLQYGDVIELTVDDVDLTPRYAVVVGTELKMSLSKVIEQTAVFEYRDIGITYFTIGVSEIGGPDPIAP
jgi:hypothetical protein